MWRLHASGLVLGCLVLSGFSFLEPFVSLDEWLMSACAQDCDVVNLVEPGYPNQTHARVWPSPDGCLASFRVLPI